MESVFELTCTLQGWILINGKPEYYNLMRSEKSLGYYKTEDDAIAAMKKYFEKDIKEGPITNIYHPFKQIENRPMFKAWCIPSAERTSNVWLCMIKEHYLTT